MHHTDQTAEDREKRTNRNTNYKIWIVAIVVTTLYAAWYFENEPRTRDENGAVTIERAGQLGDSFGVVNSYFSVMTLIVLVAGFERERARENKEREERKAEVEQLKADGKIRDAQHAAQLEKMEEQTAAFLVVVQFDAKRFRYERCLASLRAIEERDARQYKNPIDRYVETLGGEASQLRSEIQLLEEWFDRASEGKIAGRVRRDQTAV